MENNVVGINIEDEMRQSYMDYAMSVIVGRALPDVRDGLKPVQRRVLFAMFSEGHLSTKKHSKCAGVVGEVLKKYHPHGDSPVYEALVRLAQSWSLRYPLVGGQGNFGSIDGDPPAAYRYTESRMTAFAEKLLEDINKDTVDFIPNFDDSTVEPVVLPSVLPNLLVNGANGIAVGMASHMPPHNLREVIEGTIAFIKDPLIEFSELLSLIPGPDFPTGGTIYGSAPIRQAYKTGKGIITLRGKTHTERIKTQSRESEALIITEIPYQVNKSRLIERIAELTNAKEIEGIARLREESDRSGMRIVIELKRDATPEVVLNQLYKSTPLQVSFGIINLAIVEGKPVVCSLLQLIRCFVDHRRDVVTRRTQFELKEARSRQHLLAGFRLALLNLDEIISLIRGSESAREAKEKLIERFSLSPLQAQAILDLRLQKLTALEQLAVEREYGELEKLIGELVTLLSDVRLIDDVIINELEAVKETFGDDRRTEIVANAEDIDLEDLIEDEEMAITVTHQGYIKRTALTEYRAQKRGGKGILGGTIADQDYVEHLIATSSLSNLLIFTSLGRLYWMKAYQIPESGRTSKGRALVNLLEMRDDEKLTAVLPTRESSKEGYVVMATRLGVVKKVALGDFTRNRKGVIACSLDDGDTLIGVRLTRGTEDVLLITKNGMSIRFSEDDIRAMGRSARGVRGISLEDSDEVVSMTVVEPASEENPANDMLLFSVCEKGYGKKTPLQDYRVQGRGGKGIIDIQTGERNGFVVSAVAVTRDTGIMLITSGGKIIRFHLDDVRETGRNTLGVTLVNVEEGEKVVALTIVGTESGDAPSDEGGTLQGVSSEVGKRKDGLNDDMPESD
jgi:DNA gyrase subunit A